MTCMFLSITNQYGNFKLSILKIYYLNLVIEYAIIRKIIPILPQEKQTEIEQKVLESFNLRTRAKDLLEHAKRTVEIAIEQDEQAAIEWLESVS